MRDFGLAVGRIAVAVLFLVSGFGKLTGLAGFTAMLAGKGLPAPSVLAVLAALTELGCGAAIALGFKARWAALALAVFTVIATVISHDFWHMTGAAAQANKLQAMKNLAIIGAFLMLASVGPGKFSVDRG